MEYFIPVILCGVFLVRHCVGNILYWSYCVVCIRSGTVYGIFYTVHVVWYILGQAICKEYFIPVILCGMFFIGHCVGNISS